MNKVISSSRSCSPEVSVQKAMYLLGTLFSANKDFSH